MTDRSALVVLLAARWGDPQSESAFVARALAGALSRHAEVAIVTPGDPAESGADGAFDVYRIGTGTGGWPVTIRWPAPLRGAAAAVVVGGGAGVHVARAHLPRAEVVEVAGPEDPTATRVWTLTPGRAAQLGEGWAHEVGMAVPLNPLAARSRHNGFGFTDYLLVLSDRRGGGGPRHAPTPLAAWMAAGLPSAFLVVVEDAKATAFRSRSWWGEVAIDTRTDLHRLLAHARACVDLCPGVLIGRECVESMLLGTPILVPRSSLAMRYAAGGGGLWFSDRAELLGASKALCRPELRDVLGRQARDLAATQFGDNTSFVGRVGEGLRHVLAAPRPLDRA